MLPKWVSIFCDTDGIVISFIQIPETLLTNMVIVYQRYSWNKVSFYITDGLSNEAVLGCFVHRPEDLKHCLHLLVGEY